MNNGLMISQLGLRVLGLQELEDTERACLEVFKIGFHHIDTAHLYDNERRVGTSLQKCGIEKIFLLIIN